jgi:hypothetical protein
LELQYSVNTDNIAVEFLYAILKVWLLKQAGRIKKRRYLASIASTIAMVAVLTAIATSLELSIVNGNLGLTGIAVL